MRAIGEFFTRLSKQYLPDPFVFAILLTILVYILGLVFTDHGPAQLVDDWYRGFWNLLAFSMQMVLILVTGHAIATAPVVNGALRRLASLPRSGAGAIWLVALLSALLGWINWGLGLIAGAVLAKEVAAQGRARGVKVHYPLAAAAGYTGLVIWHGGLSGSAPLLVNTSKHFLEAKIGLVPLSQTIFTPFNLVVAAAILLAAPLVLMAMTPAREATEEIGPEQVAAPAARTPAAAPPATPAARLEHAWWLMGLVVLAGLVYLVRFYADKGILGLDLNVVNFTFLIVGLLLHGRPMAYARAIGEAARASAGIILQFPFYAGIMGLMSNSGLVGVIAGWFVAISTPFTYPFWTFVSASIINFAVPSGGGQWAVQGPIMVEAAQQLQVDVGRTIMAVAYGDELTNMIQPFWALPLLGITGLKVGEVMGYTAAMMLVVFVIMALGLLFLP